jgi:hypothetical protein
VGISHVRECSHKQNENVPPIQYIRRPPERRRLYVRVDLHRQLENEALRQYLDRERLFGLATEHPFAPGLRYMRLLMDTPGANGRIRTFSRKIRVDRSLGAGHEMVRLHRDGIKRSSVVPAVIALLLVAAPTHAGEIEPRAYANTPVGINFLLAGYAYTDGGLSTPGSSPIKDAQLKMNTGILAYARTLDVWGKSGKFDVIVPYSHLSGTAMVAGQPRERVVSGFHDPLFRFSVNFYGAPALSMKEFPNYRQDVIIGASVQVPRPSDSMIRTSW